jgi:hypothetical protein
MAHRVRRFDRFVLDLAGSRHRRATDGCLVVPGRVARTGIQEYDDGIGGRRREYRPPEEVGSVESVASFDGASVTDLHPDSGLITPSTYRQLTRGHVQAPSFADGWMTASFFVGDEELAKKVEAGERVEISAGYTADLDETPGVTPDGERYDAIQRNIRGNHVALLPAGTARAGREARLILDSATYDQEAPRPRRDETVEEEKKDPEAEAKPAPAEEEKPAPTEEPEEEVLDAKALKADLEAARAELGTLKAQIDAVKAALADTTAKADSEIERRLALIERASRVAGRPVKARASDEAIIREALVARGVKVDAKAPRAYLDARLDAAAELLGASTSNTAPAPAAANSSPIALALAARRAEEKRS